MKAPPGMDLEATAEEVAYIGSPEHKDTPSFAGQARPRRDASICPRELASDLLRVESWLREAIRRGAVNELWEGSYPRYVWFKDGAQVYEGRLVNRVSGEYKGYPLERDEWPIGIEDIYE